MSEAKPTAPPAHVPTERQVCAAVLRAADILEEEAEVLRACHTLNGNWLTQLEADARAKASHDEMRRVAASLRSMLATSRA